MKTKKSKKIIALLLTLALIFILGMPTVAFAAQPTVDLGTTSTFAVLAGSGVTSIGPTTINGSAGGDIGISPGSALTQTPLIVKTGTDHLNDATAIQAQIDLTAAYIDAAGRTPVIRIPTELGGTTLTPGVYDSASGTFEITGTLTLDALGDPDGVFIFKTATTLNTAGASKVVLSNGARYCRTFWQVGSSATLGIDSTFVGHIFALTSITATTGAKIQGQLLARNGAVTLDSNTITNGICAVAPAAKPPSNSRPMSHPPLINIIKIPLPLALTSGSGLVTYTYTVTNPGDTSLSNVRVTDDKISLVSYVSGDANSDNLLQTSETWIYTSQATLDTTTTNTATAKGSSGGMTATDVAYATVAVSDIIPPLINVTKIPSPLALDFGKGLVTYTYRVTNPGEVSLSNIRITDDKISLINYVSGDVNSDLLLQPSETWIYTAKVTLYQTTTNTVTAKGDANNITAIDTAEATVAVIPTTVVGGALPVTSIPWYNILFTGLALMVAGGMIWGSRKYYERKTNSEK